MTSQDVAFVGLGAMGFPMAQCLVRSGYPVVVSAHRRPEPAEMLAAQGARRARTPAEASASARVVVTMLPDEAAVEHVLLGADGVAESCPAGAVVLDMSTISPDAAKRFSAALAVRGVSFLDAPVSGGPARAEDGELAVMVGGDPEALESVGDILDCLARVVFHVGPVGSGQVVKMCNNLVGAACLLASSEALALAQSYGIPQETFRDILMAGTAANWQLENTFPISVMAQDYSPRFALPLIVKDLGIVGAMAQAQGAMAPVGDVVRRVFGEANDRFGPMDFSSVYRLYGTQEA